MVKRPLCILCCIFIVMIAAAVHIVPPSDMVKKCETEAIGRVYYREEGTNQRVFYLEHVYLKDGSLLDEPMNLIIYLSKEFNYPIGTIMKVKGVLYPLEAAANPGQFDARAYYMAKGISGRMQGKTVAEVHSEDGWYPHFQEWLLHKKEMCCQKLDLLFGNNAAEILKAMLFGVSSGIPEELKSGYEILGVGHLLAISGLHVTLLGGSFYRFCRKMGLPYCLCALCAGVLLFCYQEMQGFRFSALRAVGMFLFFLGAQVTGRAYDRLTALALVTALLTMSRPYLACTGGYWLSVCATGAAALGIERKEEIRRVRKETVYREDSRTAARNSGAKILLKENDKKSRTDRIKEFLESVEVLIWIQAVMLPLQMLFYYEIPVYGLLWNFLLVPGASVVLGFGILALLLSSFSVTLGIFAGGPTEMVLLLYELSGELGSKLPGAVYVCGKPENWQVIVYYLALAVFVWVTWPGREWSGQWCFTGKKSAVKWLDSKRVTVVSAVVFTASLAGLTFVRFHAPQEVTFLDVGQGDCAVIREEKGLNILVDGGSSDVSGVCEYRIQPFLKYNKISQLDYVFVSHGDEDHISGILGLFEQGQMKVKYLVCYEGASGKLDELKASAAARGTEVIGLHAGKVLESESMKITCLGPEQAEKSIQVSFTGEESENNQSLVLLMEYQGVKLLFTGDMELEEEQEILQSLGADSLDADILKVAHHGSNTSSSKEILEKISPVLSVISCGRDNSYGHPHEETLVRLKDSGSQVLMTMEQGAVTVKIKNGMVEVYGFTD